MKLQNRINPEQLMEILQAMKGLNRCQWDSIKSAIDYMYAKKAAKVELGDSREFEEAVTNFLRI